MATNTNPNNEQINGANKYQTNNKQTKTSNNKQRLHLGGDVNVTERKGDVL
jgi:hypothetical protein